MARKLLTFPSYSNNTTVQTCLNFCNTDQKNDTVSSPSAGFCPQPCLAICPPVCRYSLSAILNPVNSPVQPNTPHNLSPLLITMLIVLASGFLLITFYTLYTKLYFQFYHNSSNFHNQTRRNRRNNDRSVGSDFLDEEHGVTLVFHPIWYIPTVGLNPTVISSISVHKYEKGKMMDEKDCAVCLAEFEEGEELKILPKCNHAFHVTCIDTWLRSHVTCPLCRAPIVSPTDRDQTVEDLTTSMSIAVDGGVEEEDQDGVEVNLEGCLEDKKEGVEENSSSSINVRGSSSQRWSLERGAVNLVSRSLSCSAKIFSSRFNNKPSDPNS